MKCGGGSAVGVPEENNAACFTEFTVYIVPTGAWPPCTRILATFGIPDSEPCPARAAGAGTVF